jgi:hypothetical protein
MVTAVSSNKAKLVFLWFYKHFSKKKKTKNLYNNANITTNHFCYYEKNTFYNIVNHQNAVTLILYPQVVHAQSFFKDLIQIIFLH